MSFLKDFKELKKDISGAADRSDEKPKKMQADNIPGMAAAEDETGKQAGNTQVENMSDVTKEAMNQEESDVTVIAAGAVVNGDLESTGSIAVYGTVNGSINCQKKLIAGGSVDGDIHAAEIFINKANVDGNVISEGNLKIGSGSVIVGDVYGQTAVIAGAVKGEIDIKGTVIIDNTAVIRGNIKSRSVQINNGAVIEGYCTQCYRDVDVNTIFDETFPEEVKPQAQPETAVQAQPEAANEEAVQEQDAEAAAAQVEKQMEESADE